MNINILISTYGDRIQNCPRVLLPEHEFIEYVIVHQTSSSSSIELPKDLYRGDVTIIQQNERGVTRSRNLAIDSAKGDILIFADDDVSYQLDRVLNVRKVYLERPELDVALFKIQTKKGEPEYKSYASEGFRLSRITQSVSTPEITARRARLNSKKIYFDERFGAGRRWIIGGDESFFIEDCLKSSLQVHYFPYYLAVHPYESTVKQLPENDIRLACVTGAVDAKRNGGIALFKAFGAPIRRWRSFREKSVNPISYTLARFLSALYILVTERAQRRTH